MKSLIVLAALSVAPAALVVAGPSNVGTDLTAPLIDGKSADPAACSIDGVPASQPATQPTAAAASDPIEHVDVARFDELRADPNITVLDVRTAREFAAGHMPNAVNIDVTSPTFADQVAKLDKSKTYAVHCKSGGRSNQAVHKMAAAGFTKLYDLRGGITAWLHAGNQPVTGPATQPVG